jgi:tetratricopeptide (TPR) repeat protein
MDASPVRSTDGRAPPSAATLRLTPDQQRILAYASAIGPEFPFDVLREAMGFGEEELAEELEALVRRGTLVERPGGGVFAFVEEETRASVYRAMTESRHRLLHRKIAEVLERQRPDPNPVVVAELGRHYFLGKVPAKSYTFNRRAADHARTVDDPATAVHHLERALVDLGSLEGDHRTERAEVAEQLGDLSYATGQYLTADRYYAMALNSLERDAPRVKARLLLARAEVARENLDSAGAQRGAEEAMHLFESEHDALGVAQVYRLLGRIAFQEGRYREALDESMRALDGLPAEADLRARGRISIDIGNAFALLGEDVRPVAIEWYERAVDKLRASRDWVELARALHNLGTIVGETQPMDGLDYLDRAREAADRGHDVRGVGRCLLSGVELRLALGQLEEASRDNAQAGRLLERLSDYLGLILVAKNAGRIAERRGQWDDASKAYLGAVDLARRYRITAEEAEAEYFLANLRYKTRDLEGAKASVARALELGILSLSPNLAGSVRGLARHLDLPVATAEPKARPVDAEAPAPERPLA